MVLLMNVDRKPGLAHGLSVILPMTSAVVHMPNVPVSIQGWVLKKRRKKMQGTTSSLQSNTHSIVK